MELSTQMLLFARVVEKGSFSAAARELSQSPSAVSKQIGALEDRLGLRLLTRTQSGIALTSEGEIFYEQCAKVATTVGETERIVEALGDAPRGLLRINATVAFGKAQIMPILPLFLASVPELEVDLELSDRPVDLFSGTVDIAIRFSEQLDNTSVIARKLAPNRRMIVAAPSYLARNGVPQTPDDLRNHNCLRLSTVKSWNEWSFGEGADAQMIEVGGNFSGNSADAVYHGALAGIGIARLSTYLVHNDLETGRLVQVLPSHSFGDSSIYAIYSERRNLAPKIRVFLEFLTKHFGRVPPWERGQEERRHLTAAT